MAIKKINEIKIPTLVVTAEYDLVLCQAIADIIAKEIPDAELISLKDAGHMMNMDRPREFNKIIFKFIKQLKSPRNSEAISCGAEGNRTPVQTYSSKAFYMFISLLLVGDEPGTNKPIHRLAVWS